MRFLLFIALLWSCSGIRAATTEQTFPSTLYFEGPTTNPMARYVQDALGLAYANLGIKLEYRNTPLARSWVEAEAGRLDGLRARIDVVAERYPKLVKVPFPLLDFNLVLIADRRVCGACDISQLSSLATLRGLEASRVFLDSMPSVPDVVELTSTEQAMAMLQSGKVQGAIVSEPMVPPAFYKSHPHWIKYTLISYTDYHYLAPQHRELSPLVAAELSTLEQQGQLNRLKQKYGLPLITGPDKADLDKVTAVAGRWPAAMKQQGPYFSVLEQILVRDSQIPLDYVNTDWRMAKQRFFSGDADILVGAYEFETASGLLSDLHIDYQPPIEAMASSQQTLTALLSGEQSGRVCYVLGYDFNQLLPGHLQVVEVEDIQTCRVMMQQEQVDIIVDYRKNLNTEQQPLLATQQILDSRPLFLVFKDTAKGKRLKSIYEQQFRHIIRQGNLSAHYQREQDLRSARLVTEPVGLTLVTH